jgi:hypothetical protein
MADPFEGSNVPEGQRDYYLRVFAGVADQCSLPATDIEAVSLCMKPIVGGGYGPEQLALLCRTGIATGEGKGLFKLRVITEFVANDKIVTVSQWEGAERDEGISTLRLLDFGGHRLLDLRWGEPHGGRAERDRMLNLILHRD